MTVPYLVAILSLPVIALGFLLAIALPRRLAQSTPIRSAMAMLVGGPVIAIHQYHYESSLNLLLEYLLLIPGSLGAIWGGLYIWRKRDSLARVVPYSPRFCLVSGFLVGPLLLTYDVILLNKDYLHERPSVQGTVTKKYIQYDRFGLNYYAEIDGKKYHTTADVYARIEPERRVTAEVGPVSKNIFAIDYSG